MILNTSVRTDTVQYFAPWLLKRFEKISRRILVTSVVS